jgi:hypothetical protein
MVLKEVRLTVLNLCQGFSKMIEPFFTLNWSSKVCKNQVQEPTLKHWFFVDSFMKPTVLWFWELSDNQNWGVIWFLFYEFYQNETRSYYQNQRTCTTLRKKRKKKQDRKCLRDKSRTKWALKSSPLRITNPPEIIIWKFPKVEFIESMLTICNLHEWYVSKRS